MNTIAKAVATPPKEKEEAFSSACVTGWSNTGHSVQIVRGFSNMTTSQMKSYPEYKHVKDIAVAGAVLVAITATVYQTSAEEALLDMEYREVLHFRGNSDSALKFWIKDRAGDQCAEVGPVIPDIKLSDMTDVVWTVSEYYGFPSCCGAYTKRFKSRTRGMKYKRGENLLEDSSTNNLELSCVSCDDPNLGDLIYAGYFPIYKYSTGKGEHKYILAKPPSIGSGAQMLVADKPVDLHAAIYAFRKKAYKKD